MKITSRTISSAFILSTLCLSLTFCQAVIAQDAEAYDPWEPMNRGTFWFNERVDRNILGPVAEGYDAITTDSIQSGVNNFFENLKFPTLFAADILQGKFEQALSHTGRFLINSTVGILGIIDVASEVGLEEHEEDFGKVFASWGIPEGPYFVIPLMGPSTVRNTFGLIVDFITSPSYLLTRSNASKDVRFWVPLSANALWIINTRNKLDDAIKAGREGSLDYYTFQQSSYLQYRRGLEEERDVHYLDSNTKKSKQEADIDAEMDAILSHEKDNHKAP
jgi:phospholipid-binding lipoprotein MlaA